MAFPNAIPEREQYILQQVQAGNFEARWSSIVSTAGDHTAVFIVMADALKVDGVRVNVSARLEQQIADVLNASLLTPKLADLIWAQRLVDVAPKPRAITSSTQAMLAQSQALDAAVAGQDGLVCTVGKHWVIDKDLAAHPGKAENYGWHFHGSSFQGITGEVCASLMKGPNGAYVRLIQGRGWAHDMSHVDYSQNCVLVAKQCWVDGALMNLSDVLTNPDLAALASHNGVTTILRQPGVDTLESIEYDLVAFPEGLALSSPPDGFPQWVLDLLGTSC
jgi:hypothetical protein